MVYIFSGQDSFSKDVKLKKIKEEFLAKDLEDFNLDVLYARDLKLVVLQERFLCLPIGAKKRIIVIKEAEALKEDVKEFILHYVKRPHVSILLVLDINPIPITKAKPTPGSDFLNQVSRYAKVFRFQGAPQLDAFVLSRQIELRKTDYALRVLNQLLEKGERPERILGGLRYSWQRNVPDPVQAKNRLKLLLNCDIEIKTGRLKPSLALEKLVVQLCGAREPLR